MDNQSTTDICCKNSILKNIRKVNKISKLHTNGGVLVSNMKGDLPGYGAVWFHEGAITNILSLSNIKKRRKIEYDLTTGDTFIVTGKNGSRIEFKASDFGLYYYDLNIDPDFSFLQTVAENKFPYSNRQFQRGKLAREVCHSIDNPLMESFNKILRTNGLRNCPVTIEDINIAENIFGKDVSTLKGNTTRRKSNIVINDYLEVPEELKKAQVNMHLCVDIMYMQMQMFLVRVSKHIKYVTINPIKERS